jgi:3' exoribonuclease, RNase T-like
MNQVMLDLETLGHKPGAVLVAIGAVRFGGGRLGESFYERVDAQSAVDAGLQLDVSTVLWWLKQNAEARAELDLPGGKLSEVLLQFDAFLRAIKPQGLWGNGADFDNVLLAAAYDACRLPVPWKYHMNRCYRTLKNLRPDVKLTRSGVAHHALADARAQADHLMQLYPQIP